MTTSQDCPLEVDCQTVQRLRSQMVDFVLLDCREQVEYDRVRIEGTTFIPMSELPQRISELQHYTAKQIIVYCHLGGRSLRVAQWMRQQGFGRVQSMAGGIDAWARTIDTTLPTY